MAGRDNVLFGAAVASGATAGTVIPLDLVYGIENVRQGYGQPVLKNIRAVYAGCYGNSNSEVIGINVEVKNSNWIDSAGVIAQKFQNETALNRDSLSFMRGRDKAIAPNTSWIINAELPANTTAAGYVYVILEIEYSDVAGFDTEAQKGSPVMKRCKNSAVTAATNTVVSIGSFDNLLSGTEYILSEASINGTFSLEPVFLIVEGFSNQKGLIRIFPVKASGLADQIEGSVKLTKQTYNLSILAYTAQAGTPVDVALELIASKN